MKIPKNMTEEEVIETIMKVCERSAPKYTFYGYTKNDIQQQAFIICMEALERYDERRPLENFLAVNLVNRLKNFMRDNYYLAVQNEQRAKVFQPAQLSNDNTVEDWISSQTSWVNGIDHQEMLEIIDKQLPANMRLDYLKMTNDVYIAKSRRAQILGKIQEILEDHGYYEEG